MPIIIKAKKDDSTNDLIRRYKKILAATGLTDRARDRQYNIKPAQQRAIKKAQKRRLMKRARSLKKMKNVSQAAIRRIYEKLNS